MADFLTTYNNFIKPNEGYYSNAQGDLGGMTYGGISRVYNPSWEGWKIVDSYIAAKGGIKNMKWNEKIPNADLSVQNFYQKLWLDTRMNEIKSQDIANIIFDWIVNSGERNAVKPVQHILNLTEDGSIGPMTISAINKTDTAKLNNAIKLARVNFLKNIAVNNPSQSDFLKGWLDRANSFPTLAVGAGIGLLVIAGLILLAYVSTENA